MSYAFIGAHAFTKVSVKRRIDVIVLHDMEAPEKATTAESVARYFASTSGKTSAHYCVDSDSVVQCVRDNDIAYHAPPNQHSIGIEHAGYARQTRLQWLDPYGVLMLRRSATLTRELCAKYSIPKVFLLPADLRAGKRGITTHANVSKAFGQSSHTDPGPNFPIDYYMKLVTYVPPTRVVSVSRIRIAATRSPSSYPGGVRLIQKALKAEKLIGLYIPGRFGPVTRKAYSKWQRSLGYSGPDATGTPGKITLAKLGTKHGFTVKP